MRSTFIIILFFVVTTCLAQGKKNPDVFEPAYVVSLKGDTIKGTIKMPKISETELYQKITFRDEKNKQRMYLPGKINGYGLGGYYYINGFHNNRPSFLKVLSAGKFNLLQMLYEEMSESGKVIVAEFCVMSGPQGEEFVVLEEKGLKKQLKEFFKSNKSLVQKINEQKNIDYKADILEAYFKEFNESAN